MTNRLSPIGETIIEIMLTMVIILLAVTAAFQLVTMAFLQNALTENKIIATNLAREGMEAIRYIRDYNWLYYGSQPRVCWNHLQDNNSDGEITVADAECAESGTNGFAVHQIGTDNISTTSMEYALKQSGTHWFITRAGADGHIITNGDWIKITKDNVGVNADGTESSAITNRDIVKSFRICHDSNEELFVSCLNTTTPTASTFRTPFVRYVKIEYPSNPVNVADANSNGLSDGSEQNLIKIIVGVKWLEKGVMQDVELTTWLSDFYQRAPGDGIN